jgi:outer membrane protein insertion porin family
MSTIKKSVFFAVLMLLATICLSENFVINKISVVGLQRISRATVLNYLPVKKGDTLTKGKTNSIIQALYKTNFFSNITVSQNNKTLVINVTERPTISEVNITGNKQIPQDKLDDALKNLGLTKGRFLDHAVLEEVQQALQNQYYATGRYNVKMTTTQKKQSRNRVEIDIYISEGAVVKVGSINIIGNTAFSDKKILEGLHLSMPDFSTFFSREDEYSADKLQQSEQDIQNLYMNNGYIKVRITDSHVAITPDKKQAYITIKLDEGPQYHFSGYKLTGNLAGQGDVIRSLIPIQEGTVFSKAQIVGTNRAITSILGDKGYAFANVTPKPEINDKKKTVFINFDVTPGKEYFIRHINFLGNDTTSQVALRRQVYQLEGSLYSTSNINSSASNLGRNSYLDPQSPPQITPVKVPGDNDLLDLNIQVAEKLAAQFNFQIGYAQSNGLMVSTGVSQPNFMGTGKGVSFNINVNSYSKALSLSYSDPYYTPDGVSRTMSLNASTSSSDTRQVSEYTMDSYGLNIAYGFPLTRLSQLYLGYGLKKIILNQGTNVSNVVKNFLDQYGNEFDQLLLTVGISRDTRDRYLFATKGTSQNLSLTVSAPIDDHSLEYYTASYITDWFQPITSYFILHTHSNLSYGDGYGKLDGLPFFATFYAGGLGNPGINRAYYPYSLGPVDSSGRATGGNLLAGGHVSLIFSKLFDSPSVRPSIFIDGGNAFNTDTRDSTFKFKNLRYSYGAQLQWYTPLGLPLIFTVAEPINNQPNDQLDSFQFSIGTMY